MDGNVWFRTLPTTSPQRTTSFAPAIACINRNIPGRGRTRCTGENPSCDRIIADMSARDALSHGVDVLLKSLVLPGGLAPPGFFAFQVRNVQWRCIEHSD